MADWLALSLIELTRTDLTSSPFSRAVSFSLHHSPYPSISGDFPRSVLDYRLFPVIILGVSLEAERHAGPFRDPIGGHRQRVSTRKPRESEAKGESETKIRGR